MRCIAPDCPWPAGSAVPFCSLHERAPAGQRGGWISAHRRRLAMSNHDTHPLDAHLVHTRLWVGSEPPLDRNLPKFSTLALCAAEIQPQDGDIRFGGRVIRARLHDHKPSDIEVRQAVGAAALVARELRRGGNVLVTCAAGLNRSALVAGIALLQTTKLGPDFIVRLFRARRSQSCFSNPHFVELLHRLRRT